MSVQPDEDELQLRARLRDLIDHGVSPAPAERDHLEVPGSAGEETSVDALRSWADDEAQAPAAPAPRPSSPRLPDWWSKDRPPLTVVPEPEDQEEPDAPAADEDQEPGEEATSSRPRRARARTWVDNVLARTGGGTPADPEDDEEAGDTEDTEDTGDDEGEPGEGEPGEEDTGDTSGDTPAPAAPVKGGPTPTGPVRKTTGRLRLRRRSHRRPPFAAPGLPFAQPGKERRSLVEVIRNTPPHVQWLAYNGSALGAGWWLGWPQWVKEGAAFLATEHPTLTDAYSLTCYALVAGVVFLDYRARGWVLPAAWLCRVPTVSVAVGVPLHGVSTPISQLF